MIRFLAVLLCFICGTAKCAEGIRVIDGDTIEIGSTIVRLHGIDAPEHGQKCNSAQGGTWACGLKATESLRRLISGKEINCDNRGTDSYSRVIGVCKADGTDLNAEMVLSGAAWAFDKYSDDYLLQELTAKRKALGVWQAPTQPPWDFRSERWDVELQEAPNGCPIKGNISKNGRIYHTPWSPWYSRTRISLDKGERWFCDEAEALAAGWRAPYWGQ